MPTVAQLDLFAVDLPFKLAVRHAAAAAGGGLGVQVDLAALQGYVVDQASVS